MGARRDEEFVEFVTAHRHDLVRAAVLLCAGDETMAEDLVQTTLTRLYLSWGRMSRAKSQLAYARASLTHAFIDEMRRAYRRRERTHESPGQLAGPGQVEGSDPHLRQVVLTALATLGPRQRAVVVLRHWFDLDTAETARILGCSVGTVKSQNARGLAHLRELLGDLERDFFLEVGL